VELLAWDGGAPGPWETALDGAGGVINLAGEPLARKRWSESQKRLLRDTRIGSAAALVRAIEMARARPPVLINASGSAYYAPDDVSELTEDAPAGSSFLATLSREREAASQAAEALGTRVVQMRTGVVLSDENAPLTRMLPVFRLGLGGPLGSGRQWWSWIHRDDAVGLFCFALENDAVRGPLNVTAPESVTMAEFSHTLGRVLGRPAWFPVPAPILRLLLGEMADVALASLRVVPAKALQLGYQFRYPRLEPALRAVLAPESQRLESEGGSRPHER
jgi:uncharacterized protein (TIGR01777 family)